MNLDEIERIAASLFTAPIAEYLSEGSFRRVFLRDGFVFKVEHDEERYALCNEVEFAAYLAFSEMELPEDVGLPATDYLQFDEGSVIVMEYIDHDAGTGIYRKQFPESTAYTFLCDNGATDTQPGYNTRYEDGKWYPVDMGNYETGWTLL